MALKGFLTYGSTDSTSSFNERLKGLNRGFFEFTGGPIDTVSGMLKVDVNPFRAVADDGMVVVSDSIVPLTVFASETNHIVLRAKRGSSAGSDVLEIIVQTAAQFAADPEPAIRLELAEIVLGAVGEVTTEIDLTVMDKQDSFNRFSWRDTVSTFASLPMPSDPEDVRDGDVRVVLTPSLTMYGFDAGGSTWVGLATGEINTASNIGLAGVGLFDGKSGPDLEFRNIAPGSSGTVTVTNNPTDNTVEIEVVAATSIQGGGLRLTNHLGGTAALPEVVGMTTTTGPTSLSIAGIANLQGLVRSGTSIVGADFISAESAPTSTQHAISRYTSTDGLELKTSATRLENSGSLTLGATTVPTANLHLVESGSVDNGVTFENILSGGISSIFQDYSFSDALTLQSDADITLDAIGAGSAITLRSDTDITLEIVGGGIALTVDAGTSEIKMLSPYDITLSDGMRIDWGTAASGTSITGNDSSGTVVIDSSTGNIRLDAGDNIVLNSALNANTIINHNAGGTLIATFDGSSGDFLVDAGNIVLSTALSDVRFGDITHRLRRNASDVMVIVGDDGIRLDSEDILDMDAVGDITVDTTTGGIFITSALDDVDIVSTAADIRITAGPLIGDTITITSGGNIVLDATTGGVVRIDDTNLLIAGTGKSIIFDSTTDLILTHGTADGLIIVHGGETPSATNPDGLMLVADSSGTAIDNYVVHFENTSTFTGVQTRLMRLTLQSDVDVGGFTDYFIRAFAEEGGVPALQWSLDGEGTAVMAFTGQHPVIYTTAAGGTLMLDEVKPGCIVESDGTVWDYNVNKINNAHPQVVGSSTNNSTKVFGVLTDSYSKSYDLGIWNKFSGALNSFSMCPVTQIVADLTWDGTTTILTSDTSEVTPGQYIKFGELASDEFLVDSVVSGTSVTITNPASLTIPTGSGANASYMGSSDTPDPVQQDFTTNSVSFKAQVNSLGDGLVWVSDFGGDVNNGDYISSSEVVDDNGIFGYGQKQSDDIMHSYTVAKCTETVNWAGVTDTFVYNTVTYKRALVACTYHCG